MEPQRKKRRVGKDTGLSQTSWSYSNKITIILSLKEYLASFGGPEMFYLLAHFTLVNFFDRKLNKSSNMIKSLNLQKLYKMTRINQRDLFPLGKNLFMHIDASKQDVLISLKKTIIENDAKCFDAIHEKFSLNSEFYKKFKLRDAAVLYDSVDIIDSMICYKLSDNLTTISCIAFAAMSHSTKVMKFLYHEIANSEEKDILTKFDECFRCCFSNDLRLQNLDIPLLYEYETVLELLVSFGFKPDVVEFEPRFMINLISKNKCKILSIILNNLHRRHICRESSSREEVYPGGIDTVVTSSRKVTYTKLTPTQAFVALRINTEMYLHSISHDNAETVELLYPYIKDLNEKENYPVGYMMSTALNSCAIKVIEFLLTLDDFSIEDVKERVSADNHKLCKDIIKAGRVLSMVKFLHKKVGIDKKVFKSCMLWLFENDYFEIFKYILENIVINPHEVFRDGKILSEALEKEEMGLFKYLMEKYKFTIEDLLIPGGKKIFDHIRTPNFMRFLINLGMKKEHVKTRGTQRVIIFGQTHKFAVARLTKDRTIEAMNVLYGLGLRRSDITLYNFSNVNDTELEYFIDVWGIYPGPEFSNVKFVTKHIIDGNIRMLELMHKYAHLTWEDEYYISAYRHALHNPQILKFLTDTIKLSLEFMKKIKKSSFS